MRDEEIVQPAGPGKAHLVGRVEHGGGLLQQGARVIERDRLQEILRRHPGPAAEKMMQFGRADTGSFRDRFDLGLHAPVAANMSDGAADDFVIVSGALERG